MHIETLVVGSLEANCYLVWSEPRQAIVIDPGADADVVSSALDEHGLDVAAYLLTHGHVDHISGLARLYRREAAPVGIHSLDGSWSFESENHLPPFYGSPERPPNIYRDLGHGQKWEDGGMAYTVLSTPGHTPGSVCFWFPEDHSLFSGDTLFAGSVGRTDLPGGNPRALARSLARIAALPEDTAVYPGHGQQTMISREKRCNPFMQRLEVMS